MYEVALRPASTADLERIALLESHVYALEGAWSLDDFEHDFASANRCYLVADAADGTLAGYAIAERVIDPDDLCDDLCDGDELCDGDDLCDGSGGTDVPCTARDLCSHTVLRDAAALTRRSRTFEVVSVSALTVDLGFRRTGLGRRMLDELLAWAGPVPVVLSVRAGNAAAIALYTSCGFETLGVLDSYYSPGVHALWMRRP